MTKAAELRQNVAWLALERRPRKRPTSVCVCKRPRNSWATHATLRYAP